MTPAHVLAVYAEPLVAGRRVALLGPEDPALVDAVLALGARLLYVYDPRPSVETTRKGPDPRLTVAPLRAGDLGVREGAFDLALVPDLTLLGDPEASLAYVRRLVGNAGAALVASRNRAAREPWTQVATGPEPPTYTELYDLCALQFAEVRMVGVAPFAAYAVAEFAPDREPSIAFDASLVTEPDPPEWFVAVASQSPTAVLEAYEIVQIPRDAIAAGEPVTETGELEATRRRLGATEQKLHEAEARAGEEVLRAERLSNELRNQGEELRKLRERAARAAKELEDERRARQRVETDLEGARNAPELAQLRERTLGLEAQLIEARTQLATPRTSANEVRLGQERDALAAEIASLRAAREQSKATTDELRHRLAERERELDASLRRAKQLEDRLAEQLAETSRREDEHEAAMALVERVQHAEALAGRLDAELTALQTTHEHDVAQLEAALRAAGDELRLARTELVRRERMVRELVAQIEELQDVLPVAAPQVRVEPDRELVAQLDLARRELARLDDEVKRRDRMIDEARRAIEASRRELEGERAKTEQLAREAARREAALQTSSWRIAELEKLGSESDEAPDERRIRLESELDALRRALAQEHARVEELERTLSASDQDELARARARLEEQSALIAQLSAELASRQG